MHIKDVISKDLGIPKYLIDDAINVARVHVKIFRIKKKNGGCREIFHPSKKLKTIQYWLIHNVFRKLTVHNSAMAYREGISILDNALLHRNNRFFLKMDFENFFPSIDFKDLLPTLVKWHDESKPKWKLDEEAKELIKNACFFKEDKLAVGYPSSPIISNVVMLDFDLKVNALILDKKYGNACYTRYADDLVFSTDQKGACKYLRVDIEKLVKNTKHPKIKINNKKTRFGTSTGGSASVTGLKVCADGHITIHRKQKNHIRLMLSLYSKGKLTESEQETLLGHLSYSHHVAPQFYSKLSMKYFKEIHTLKHTTNG